MNYIEGTDRKQTLLFPEVIDEYIEEDNAARFIDAFIDNIDLFELGFSHAVLNTTGRPPYQPSDLLKLYIYGYLNCVRSSRRLEKETKRNVEVMWLIRKLSPDFKTIADFRRDNKDGIKKVFRQFILLCKELDLFSGELVAIDSSKFKAVNSVRRNLSRRHLKKRIIEIDKRIEEYLKEMEENDSAEEKDKLFKKVATKEKIQGLKKKQLKYKKYLEELKVSGDEEVSLTDKDSRAMKVKNHIEIGYNVQITSDEKHKLILDYEVLNQPNDYKQLSKMSLRAKEILGSKKLEVLADKGYYEYQEIKDCIDNGIIPYIPETKSVSRKGTKVPTKEFYKDKFRYDKQRDIYICPEGFELRFRNKVNMNGKVMKVYKSRSCKTCFSRFDCTRNRKEGRIITRWEHQEIIDNMRERVKRSPEKVKKRQMIIEHIFGTIKRNSNQGYFLMKGLRSVSCEIGLTALAYNIKRVINIIGVDRLIAVVMAKTNVRTTDILTYLRDIRKYLSNFIYFLKFLKKIALNLLKCQLLPIYV